MRDALRQHWPEYFMEAAGLGLFMISAGVFGTLLEYPGSPVQQAVADPFLRRILMGTAMGLTAIGIIYSPWGKQSGAHLRICPAGPTVGIPLDLLHGPSPRHAAGIGGLPASEGRPSGVLRQAAP